MEKSKSINNVLKGVLVLLVVVFIAAGAFLGVEIWDNHRSKFHGEGSVGNDTIVFDGKEYVLNKNISTFLVLGLDKYKGTAEVDSYNNDKQADFLMLFVFDNLEQKYTVIHVNRDTMANVNVLGVAGNKVDTVKKQIALAHTYGNGKNVSCQNTSDAVSELFFGISVDHYISLSLDSVALFNDLVGGVEVEVLHDFTGVDDTLIKGEKVLLKGEHALNYVKERRGVEDSTNAERMERQKQYLEALREKTFKCMDEDAKFTANAAVKMGEYIVSDRSVTQLQELAKKIKAYEYTGMKDIEGTAEKGEEYIEFYPDKDALHKLVIDTFYLRTKD